VTDAARVAAERLFNKLTREDKSSVTTVGVGKSYHGGEVLLVFCPPDSMAQIPENFEGFGAYKRTSSALRRKEEANA
jgi:hypothetical protein